MTTTIPKAIHVVYADTCPARSAFKHVLTREPKVLSIRHTNLCPDRFFLAQVFAGEFIAVAAGAENPTWGRVYAVETNKKRNTILTVASASGDDFVPDPSWKILHYTEGLNSSAELDFVFAAVDKDTPALDVKAPECGKDAIVIGTSATGKCYVYASFTDYASWLKEYCIVKVNVVGGAPQTSSPPPQETPRSSPPPESGGEVGEAGLSTPA